MKKYITNIVFALSFILFMAEFPTHAQLSGGVEMNFSKIIINGSTSSTLLNITAPNGEKISGVDLNFKTTQNLKIDKLGPVKCVDKNKTYEEIVNNVSAQSAKIIAVNIGKSEDLCNSLQVNVSMSGGGLLTLDNNASQVSGTGSNLTYPLIPASIDIPLISSGDQDFPLPFPKDEETNGDVIARFSPKSVSTKVGSTVTQNLVIYSQNLGAKISAWDVTVKYSGGYVKIANIGDAISTQNIISSEGESFADTDTEGKSKCVEIAKSISADKSEARMSFGCILSDEDLPQAVSMPIRLTGVKNGSGFVQVKAIEVVGNTDDPYTVGKRSGVIKVGEDVSDEPDISSGPDQGGATVNVAMTLRLQGVPTRPNRPRPVGMKIGFGDAGMAKTKYTNATFNFDDNGLLRGSVSMALSSLRGLKTLIKCDHCIQKKICDSTPTESVPGIYVCDKGKINLKAGSNQLDLSTVLLLVGDLGEQDGITNSFDIALVRNNFGRSDDEALKVADLNYDGEVNQLDYALVIRALSIKRDEP